MDIKVTSYLTLLDTYISSIFLVGKFLKLTPLKVICLENKNFQLFLSVLSRRENFLTNLMVQYIFWSYALWSMSCPMWLLGWFPVTGDVEKFSGEVLKFALSLCTPDWGSLSSLSVESWLRVCPGDVEAFRRPTSATHT